MKELLLPNATSLSQSVIAWKTRKGLKEATGDQPAKRANVLNWIDKQDDTDNGKHSSWNPKDIRFNWFIGPPYSSNSAQVFIATVFLKQSLIFLIQFLLKGWHLARAVFISSPLQSLQSGFSMASISASMLAHPAPYSSCLLSLLSA